MVTLSMRCRLIRTKPCQLFELCANIFNGWPPRSDIDILLYSRPGGSEQEEGRNRGRSEKR